MAGVAGVACWRVVVGGQRHGVWAVGREGGGKGEGSGWAKLVFRGCTYLPNLFTYLLFYLPTYLPTYLPMRGWLFGYSCSYVWSSSY